MQKLYNIYFFVLTAILCIIEYHKYYHKDSTNDIDNIEIVSDNIDLYILELNDSNLRYVLDIFEVEHPSIVHAQAILETGNYNSKVCLNYNNLFGLYDSTRKDYYRFNHWTESVLAYKNKVQYKFYIDRYKPPDGNYYQFLKNMGYAEDPNYNSKLKRIVKTKNL